MTKFIELPGSRAERHYVNILLITRVTGFAVTPDRCAVYFDDGNSIYVSLPADEVLKRIRG